MEKNFDGIKRTKLGTEKKPAVISVQTEERMKEIVAIFDENGWACEVEVDPDKPENIADMELLQNPLQPVVSDKKTGRNEPCSCGSGKKYKKCCGA